MNKNRGRHRGIDCRTGQNGWRNVRKSGGPKSSSSSGSDSRDLPEPHRPERLPSKVKHNLFTHVLKDPNCERCKRPKVTRAACRRKSRSHVPRATQFGDIMGADHKVLNGERESRNNQRYAIVVQDMDTQWIHSYPCKTQTSKETARNLLKFFDHEEIPKVMYTDNSLEFGKKKACEDLQWNQCTCTPHWRRRKLNGRLKEE